jgi:hypothetical protein
MLFVDGQHRTMTSLPATILMEGIVSLPKGAGLVYLTSKICGR